MQARPDAVANQRVSTAVNSYPNETLVYETVRRVRKQLKAPYPHVLLNALMLTEELMTNSGQYVRREVGNALSDTYDAIASHSLLP